MTMTTLKRSIQDDLLKKPHHRGQFYLDDDIIRREVDLRLNTSNVEEALRLIQLRFDLMQEEIDGLTQRVEELEGTTYG